MAVATKIATASEISDASQAVIRMTPSSTNSTTSGSAAKMQESASESLTGSRTCWYTASPSCGFGFASHPEIGGREAADGRVEHLDGVREGDLAAEAADRRGGLHQAARIGRDEQLRPGGHHVLRLAVPELLGRFGVEDVPDAGRAAADVLLRDLSQLDAGDAAEQLAGLVADALRVAEVAGVVVRDTHRQRMAGRDGACLGEDLRDVADPVGERAGFLGVRRIVGQEVRV